MNDTAAQFTAAVGRYRNILIYIQGSPDPDAIASSFALKIILSRLGIRSKITLTKKISLPQNRAFVRLLDIHLADIKKTDISAFDSYIIADFQSNFVQGISGKIPCAAHIDHHEAGCDSVPSDFSLIRPDAGSTSALVAWLVRNIGIEFTRDEMKSMATALIFGIQTDTDEYRHATETDMKALKYLSAWSDSAIINRISGIPLSHETMLCYKNALEKELVYREWGIYGAGFIEIGNRDSIAITADLLLKKTKHKTVVVFAIVEDRVKHDLFIDVSFRTDNPLVDLNTIIKKITPTGGGRKFKGAYQVRMKYFSICPDRELLRQLVETTTIARIKEARDGIYLEEIKRIPARILNRISSLLKNK